MGLDHLSGTSLVPLTVATIVLTAVLILIARVIWRDPGDRSLGRPSPASHGCHSGHRDRRRPDRPVGARGRLRGVRELGPRHVPHGRRRTEDGITQPMQPTVSGSPDSLIPWDTLGLQGRTIVARATPEAELKKFPSGRKVLPPIRIYSGLASADEPADAADLAVRDLERAGFDRAVLVVTTVTGTGWVDPTRRRSSSSTAATRR